jgi:transcriptional regulator with XRE-family HTH domain
VRLDTSAFLAVLLASTGLTQAEAAALFQVDGRTVRRWLEGTRPTPEVAIERLNAWAYALDQTAQAIIMRTGAPGALLVYRRDRDVPPWSGLRTAGSRAD